MVLVYSELKFLPSVLKSMVLFLLFFSARLLLVFVLSNSKGWDRLASISLSRETLDGVAVPILRHFVTLLERWLNLTGTQATLKL